MKGIFLVLAIVMALGCVGRQKAKTSDQTETKLVAGDRVEVMYFHGKQRCITCRSIEQQVREVFRYTGFIPAEELSRVFK